MTKLPRGIRNHNPGNIEWGDNWQGLVPIGERTDNRFCQFVAPVWGIRAIARVLITYYDKRVSSDGSKIDTVREIIERWAPASENDVNSYVRAVRRAMFGDPDAPEVILNLHEYHTIRPLIDAIIRHENGKGPLNNANTWYTDDVIDEGLRLAGVKKPVSEVAKVPVTKETVAAATTGAVGVAEVADALPGVVKAVESAEGHLSSGSSIRLVIGFILIAAAAFIAYSQIKRNKSGTL